MGKICSKHIHDLCSPIFIRFHLQIRFLLRWSTVEVTSISRWLYVLLSTFLSRFLWQEFFVVAKPHALGDSSSIKQIRHIISMNIRHLLHCDCLHQCVHRQKQICFRAEKSSALFFSLFVKWDASVSFNKIISLYIFCEQWIIRTITSLEEHVWPV